MMFECDPTALQNVASLCFPLSFINSDDVSTNTLQQVQSSTNEHWAFISCYGLSNSFIILSDAHPFVPWNILHDISSRISHQATDLFRFHQRFIPLPLTSMGMPTLDCRYHLSGPSSLRSETLKLLREHIHYTYTSSMTFRFWSLSVGFISTKLLVQPLSYIV